MTAPQPPEPTTETLADRLETPRTDKSARYGSLFANGWYSVEEYFVPADFARTLERELAQAAARLRELVQERDEWKRTDDVTMTAFGKLEERFKEQVLRAEAAESTVSSLRESERHLSDAYIRLRTKLEAFDTPFAPTPEQVWAHTEAKLDAILATASSQAEEIARWRDKAESRARHIDTLQREQAQEIEALREALNRLVNSAGAEILQCSDADIQKAATDPDATPETREQAAAFLAARAALSKGESEQMAAFTAEMQAHGWTAYPIPDYSASSRIAALESSNARLRAALQGLMDEQNGPPLERRREQWQAAMDEARRAMGVK